MTSTLYEWQSFLRRILIVSLLVFSSSAISSPGTFVYTGQIKKSDNSFLEANPVTFTVQIFSQGAEECLLYKETHVLNMTDSGGVFSLAIGNGARSGANFEDTSLVQDVFSNGQNFTGVTCAVGSSYLAGPNDRRKLRMTYDDGIEVVTIATDHNVQSVPYAAMAITNGNVGIGTASPSYKLHVNGSVAGVGAYNNLSDKRLKRDIASIPSPLKNLLQLKGVTYNWKRDENPELDFPEGPDMGVIAQDVQSVFPEAVVEDDKGLLSVAYSKLIAPIIEAIRELTNNDKAHTQEISSLNAKLAKKDREIASLKKEGSEQQIQINQQKSEISHLKSRLEAIEKILQK